MKAQGRPGRRERRSNSQVGMGGYPRLTLIKTKPEVTPFLTCKLIQHGIKILVTLTQTEIQSLSLE